MSFLHDLFLLSALFWGLNMHSVCKAFPSFLLLTWLRCLQNWVLVTSCIPVLLVEGWGGGMNLLLWRLIEMCLRVAKSPVLEADGEFKQQLHKSPKTIQVWSGRPWELAHMFGRGSSVEAWWGKPLTLGTLWRCLFFSSAGQCNGLPWHCGPVQWRIWCVCASQS